MKHDPERTGFHFRHVTNKITDGRRPHTHLGTCINCGSLDGGTLVYVTVRMNHDDMTLNYEGMGNKLCLQCKADLIPLTSATTKKLDKLSEETWRAIKRRCCPCCAAGVDWFDTPLAH
jgi:hypothetical protein